MSAYVVASVAAVLFISAVAITYNRLVRSRERVREAWSGVDVQLQRRADLVPNLVEIVRGYAGHERGVLVEVTRARGALHSARTVTDATAANRELTGAITHVYAVAEAVPELRAAESFTALQLELSDIEEKIGYARHFYNGNVLDYNTRIGRFPALLVARMFRFRPQEFFEAEEEAAAAVAVRLGDRPAPDD